MTVQPVRAPRHAAAGPKQRRGSGGPALKNGVASVGNKCVALRWVTALAAAVSVLAVCATPLQQHQKPQNWKEQAETMVRGGAFPRRHFRSAMLANKFEDLGTKEAGTCGTDWASGWHSSRTHAGFRKSGQVARLFRQHVRSLDPKEAFRHSRRTSRPCFMFVGGQRHSVAFRRLPLRPRHRRPRLLLRRLPQHYLYLLGYGQLDRCRSSKARGLCGRAAGTSQQYDAKWRRLTQALQHAMTMVTQQRGDGPPSPDSDMGFQTNG